MYRDNIDLDITYTESAQYIYIYIYIYLYVYIILMLSANWLSCGLLGDLANAASATVTMECLAGGKWNVDRLPTCERK